MKFKTCFLSFLCLLKISEAQELPQLKSPDVAALNKHIEFPIDKSTGTANVNIPIYNMKIGKFDLPISLSYHTGGIKVEEMSSSVGLGWALNAGGSISRSIRGTMPDELGYYAKKGFDEIFHWAYGMVAEADREPDIFSFSIAGYSGKFLFDKYQKVQLIPEQDLKVTTGTEGNPGRFEQFTITTPDGTTYIFSGVYDYSAIYGLNTSSYSYNPEFTPTAWRLTKIVTLAGDEINFEYQDDGFSAKINERQSVSVAANSGFCAPCMTKTAMSFNYGHALKKISSRNLDVFFNYKASLREDIKPGYGSARALSEIKVIDKWSNETVKSFVFKTSYFQSDDNISVTSQTAATGTDYYTVDPYLQKRLRLDEMQEVQSFGDPLPSYRFFYNKNNPVLKLPNRLSNAQDHWGYYNGQSQNRCLIGLYSSASCSPNSLANRNVNASLNKAFILDEIVFPTGGTTKYIYDSGHTSLPGLRIKEIQTHSGILGDIVKRNFIYGNGQLTGGAPVYVQSYPAISANVPVHIRQGLIWIGDSECLRSTYPNETNSYLAFENPANYTGEVTSNFVYYEKVTEVQVGNGSVESNYSTVDINDLLASTDTYPTIFSPPALLAGKLLSEIVRREDGTSLRETFYTYDYYYRLIVKEADAARVFKMACAEAYQYYPIFTGSAFLTEKKVFSNEVIAGQGGINSKVVTTSYGYSGIPDIFKNRQWANDGLATRTAPTHQMVTSEVLTLSDGSLFTKRSKYPLDYASDISGSLPSDLWDSASKGLKRLTDRGVKNFPVEEITTITKGGIEKVTSGKLVSFESIIDAGSGKEGLNPAAVYELGLINPIGYSSSLFDSRIAKGADNLYRLNHNGNYKRKLSLDKYDRWSNLVEYRAKSDPPSSFIWRYNQTYPVAEAKNASSSEVFYEGFEESSQSGVLVNANQAHTGLKYFNSNRYTVNWTRPNNRKYIISYWYRSSGGMWLHKEQDYTSNVIELSDGTGYDDICIFPTDAQISLYTYLPSRGVTSIIDVSNKKTHFEYDGFGRLLNVKDHNKDIIRNYTYHYNDNTTQYLSASKSGTFQKNNCPNQAIGSNVVYQVPYGKYTSFISQQDADAQAQADVNANGLDYANAHGTCSGGNVLYYNDLIVQTFIKECTNGQKGSEVEYIVDQNKYSSAIDKNDANAKAWAEVNTNGQTYANTNGTCRSTTNLEWTSYVSDCVITGMRFYNAGRTSLLFQLTAEELMSQQDTHLIDRGVYYIEVDVKGGLYSNGVGYGSIKLNAYPFAAQCRPYNEGPVPNRSTYHFTIDLTNISAVTFNLEGGSCN